jgi:hypothetical protein
MKRPATLVLMVLFLVAAAAAAFIAWTTAQALPLAAAVVFLAAGLFLTTQLRPDAPAGGKP